jgi:hypothetical protein
MGLAICSSMLQAPDLQVRLDLVNNLVSCNFNNKSGIAAVVKLKNIQCSENKFSSTLLYSHKSGSEMFYLEAFDLDGNEININGDVDHNWFPQLNKQIVLDKRETLIDTNYLSPIYDFKNGGFYILRMVYDASKPIEEKRVQSKNLVYSN